MAVTAIAKPSSGIPTMADKAQPNLPPMVPGLSREWRVSLTPPH